MPAAPPAHRRAAATLEFAVVIPALFLMIFGMIEVGRGFMVIHLLENAARTGCRSAVVDGATTDSVTAAVSDVLTPQGVTKFSTDVLVNGKSGEVSSAASGAKVTVVVSAAVGDVTWVPGGSLLKGSLAGRFSLRKE